MFDQVDQVDTVELRLAFEAATFHKRVKARRAYHCRFCGGMIAAGEHYLQHNDRAAHPSCVEQLAAIIRPAVSRVR